MAIHPQNYHEPMHSAFACATGNGKGIAVTSLGWVEANKPLVIFDPYGEYKTKFGKRNCNQYKSKRGFLKAFRNAWQNYQVTKQPFVISYHPAKASNLKDRIEEREWFSKMIWTASDGRYVLYCLFEEYGACSDSVSKDDGYTGMIYTGGRKFGLRAGAIFQRSAEVPKTIWGNARYKFIGAQEFTADAKRIVDQLGCTAKEVAELGILNEKFAMYAPDIDARVKTKTHYLCAVGMGHFTKQAAMVEPARKLTKNWSNEQKQLNKSSDFLTINP
ncbi:hypothetical protein HR060_10725 [Catenovulum sp. SM1970]|uniref:hypothetical protein n=1 Tax=Marinifaba aquimaris TaxID=2741323 RepID=UPI0015722C3B|nr:hypothetical protein [Marinifaba aquimaris]NTS77338.1 hypothetical protein [Marinifaba aquimaris]